MKWNFDNTKVLVENVQKYPQLYNIHVTYNNPAQNQETWDIIATAVGNGATGFICKQRWQFLRNAYRNHVKFGYQVSPAGIELHLKFLAPFFRTRAELAAKPYPTDSLEYCKKLAEIVKEYPHLYFDVRSSEHSDDWQKVATCMGTGDTPEQCTLYWSQLRTSYSYHLKRNTRMKPSGIKQHLGFLDTPLTVREETRLDSTIRLINLVRENFALYQNPNSSAHLVVWKDVAEQMGNGATARECETNWRSLRNAYANCLQKGIEMQQIGIVDHLDFLKPYLTQPETKTEPKVKRIRLDEKATRAKLRRDAAMAAVLSHSHLKFGGEDEDMLFLFEFLQDMSKMDDAAKMTFKLGAMKLAAQFRSPCIDT